MKILLSTLFALIISFCGYSQGSNWQSLNGPTGGYIVDLVQHSNGNIFAAIGSNGVFKSTDNGATWAPTATLPGGDVYIYDLEIDGAGKIYALGENVLYASTDLGQSWATLSTDNGVTYYSSKSIKKTGTTLYLNATSQATGLPGIFKSTNDGGTFSPVYTPALQTNYIYELLIHNSGTLLIKVDGIGILTSTNNGTNWNPSNTGITNPTLTNNFTNGQGMITDAAGNLYALFESGIYKSTNASAGATWTALTKPASETSFITGALSSTGTTLFLGISGHTYYTSTAAISWTKTGDLFALGRYLPLSATSLLAGTQAGLFATSNTGVNWAESNTGITGRSFTDMVYYNNSNFVVAPDQGLVTSNNQGVSWITSASPEMVGVYNNDLLYLPNGNIFAFNNGCDKSIDGGTVWTNVTTPAGFTEGDSYDGSTIFARSGNSIYKTTNYGVNWGTPLAITGLTAPYSISNISASATSLFIFLRNTTTPSAPISELWKVSLTTLAATKITGLSFANNLYGKQIWSKGGKIYFFSKSVTTTFQLSVSANDGVSWTTQTVPNAARFVVANNGYLVLCAGSGACYFSRDDGSSWVDVALGYATVTGITLRQALVDADGFLYVLLDNKGVLKSVKPVVLPDPPANLSVVGFGHDKMTLLWDDNADNETYYVIERSLGDNTHYDSANAVFSSDQTATKAFFVEAALTPNTKFYYRIKAVNDAGESTFSNEINATTLAACAAAIPDGRSWTGVTQNLSGKGAFTNTQIGIRYVGNGSYSISDFTGGIYSAIFGLATIQGNFTEDCGATHLYAGNRVLSSGNGTYNSTTKKVTLTWQTSPVYHSNAASQFSESIVLSLNPVTSDPTPGAPTNVSAFVYDDTGIEVQWTAGFFQNKYVVERSTASNFATFTALATVDAPAVTIIDRGISFVTNSTYYYRVRAVNSNNVASPNSSTASVVFKKPYFVPLATVAGTADYGVARYSSAFIDFDNDNDEDLFMAPNAAVETNFLIENKGGGIFARKETNLPTGGFVNSAWADFNNDGIIDIAGTRQDNNSGQAFIEIYTGNGTGGIGNGTFTKVNGLPVYDYYFSGTITWMDYNADGKLDLLFALHRAVDLNQGIYTAELRVLRNEGGTTFTDLSIINFGSGSAGIFVNDSRPFDYDNDGDVDILVTGFDSGGGGKNSVMLKNDGTGNFIPTNIPAFNINGTNDAFSSTLADIDNDGDMDVFIAYYGTSNGLFKNNGNGTFTYLSANAVSEAAVSNTYGGVFGDIDNDGDLDLFVGNNPGTPADLQYIYINDGLGNFTRVTGEFATNYFRFNYAASFGDFDKDGFLDLAIAFPDKNNTILKNNKKISTTGNWIEVKLKGKSSNTLGIGALVSVTAAGKTQTRIIQSNSGGAYNGESSLIAHFGLGSTAAIDSIHVKWPSGVIQHVSNPTINSIVVITEDKKDKIFPEIAFTPIPTIDKGFASPTTFSITVTDNSNVVASATLYYRKISGSYKQLAGVGAASNVWNFSVPDTFFDDNGLEYYFKAVDPSDNVTREPADSSRHVTYMKYPGTTSKIPTLGFGGQAGNWKIFSIPFELGSNNSVSAIFDELPTPYDRKSWRILTYKDASAWGEVPGDFSTIARGKGYFINIRNQIDVIVGSNVQAAPNTQANLFHLTLKKGWNQIGNPYLTPIDWGNVSTINGLTGSDLNTFSGGTYQLATVLPAYTGGFVFSDADNDIDLKIPFQGQTVEGRTQQPETDISRTDWRMNLGLRQQDLFSELSGIGMNPKASISRDAFDGFTPPRFYDYLEINFPHPEHFAKQFARDIVTTQPEYTWEFTADSNLGGMAELTWDNTGFGNNPKELVLFDVAQQKITDMRSRNNYTFNPAQSGKFRIYFGENLEKKIRPDYILLGKAYPNPVAGSTTIPFNLPEGNSKYQVRLEVYDMMGKKITTLVDDELVPGFYSTEWNMSSSNLGDGLYLYRLLVANQKNGIQTGKITLQK